MPENNKYIDFTIAENKDGWLAECYNAQDECPADIQVSYWSFMTYVKDLYEWRKVDTMAWISDADNIGAVNDLIAEFVNARF